ncbi:copper chaperone NosL [Algoriphagus boseongensis]|uniref:Copper chaperone NosL n=1 Tax=Algoriphagus boseongensis TaxID=1442587 RepID=A0A4R6T7A9_9BACT|nr:nitrous oxide reductase accessory protein NosL [Algoriphagus boseongensis]TDQ16561.1 copper chaperone NosL [Algoriphagus boseongensis]
MKRIFLLLAILSAVASCTVEPRPILYGEDGCHHCKMTLVDPKYGTELVTQKGKVLVFDDLNCMLNYMNSPEGMEQEYKHLLVVDYLQEGVLLEAKDAFYLKSEVFKSPMVSQIAAFKDYDQLKKIKQESGGIYLAWGELVTQFK